MRFHATFVEPGFDFDCIFGCREMIGTVMQKDQLLAGSIADNISFFDPHSDPMRIEHCTRLAAIHHEIEAMRMRYNSLIGDMGTVLHWTLYTWDSTHKFCGRPAFEGVGPACKETVGHGHRFVRRRPAEAGAWH